MLHTIWVRLQIVSAKRENSLMSWDSQTKWILFNGKGLVVFLKIFDMEREHEANDKRFFMRQSIITTYRMKLNIAMKGAMPIPSAIKMTRSQPTIDSMGLWNGPSAMKLNFLSVEYFRLFLFDLLLRFIFSIWIKSLKIFSYSSRVQSPLVVMYRLNIVFFGSTTESMMVNGCHSSVEIFSHCNKIKSPGYRERCWFTRNVKTMAFDVGSSIETNFTRAKNRLK